MDAEQVDAADVEVDAEQVDAEQVDAADVAVALRSLPTGKPISLSMTKTLMAWFPKRSYPKKRSGELISGGPMSTQTVTMRSTRKKPMP